RRTSRAVPQEFVREAKTCAWAPGRCEDNTHVEAERSATRARNRTEHHRNSFDDAVLIVSPAQRYKLRLLLSGNPKSHRCPPVRGWILHYRGTEPRNYNPASCCWNRDNYSHLSNVSGHNGGAQQPRQCDRSGVLKEFGDHRQRNFNGCEMRD